MEQRSDRPISGRRSSFRNNVVTPRQTEEQQHRAAALPNTGMPFITACGDVIRPNFSMPCRYF